MIYYAPDSTCDPDPLNNARDYRETLYFSLRYPHESICICTCVPMHVNIYTHPTLKIVIHIQKIIISRIVLILPYNKFINVI